MLPQWFDYGDYVGEWCCLADFNREDQYFIIVMVFHFHLFLLFHLVFSRHFVVFEKNQQKVNESANLFQYGLKNFGIPVTYDMASATIS